MTHLKAIQFLKLLAQPGDFMLAQRSVLLSAISGPKDFPKVLPPLDEGYAYVVDHEGTYITDYNGDYVYAKTQES